MNDENTITVLDLLNLALGTPEIGAVNFNLLHRFLLELVKHFALARKQIDITDDMAVQAALEETRSMSAPRSQLRLCEYNSLGDVVDGNRSCEIDEKRDGSVPGRESGVHKKETETDVKCNEDMKQSAEDNAKVGEEISDVNDEQKEVKSSEPQEKNDGMPQSSGSSEIRSTSPSPKTRSESSSVGKGSKRSSPGASKSDLRRRSVWEMNGTGLYQLERKISILEAKIEALGAAPTNMEIVQQARELQRENSATAAGDMWQTMNIVRRIEAAEGAINGITTMLDDISEQLRNVKDNSSDFGGVTKSLHNDDEGTPKTVPEPAVVKYPKNKANDELEKLQTKLSKMDEKLSSIVSRSDLKGYLTVEKMNEMIDFKLSSFKPSQPRVPAEQSSEAEELSRSGGTSQPSEVDMTHESIERMKNIAEEDRRRLSVNSEAVQELNEKIHNWSQFRDEITLQMDEVLKRLRNTVDQSALSDLKRELSQLAKTHSPVTDEQSDSGVTRQDLDLLKKMTEEKLQSSEKHLQEMKQNFFPFYEMKETVVNVKDFADLLKSDVENIRKELLKVLKKVDTEQGESRESRCVFPNSGGRKHSFNIGDNEEFHHMRASLLEMKNEMEKHGAVVGQILEEQNKKQLHLDTLYNHVDNLENTKADRQELAREIDVKADRKDLEQKIGHDKFNNSLSCLDQSVQDLMEKLVGHEATLRQAIDHITSDVNSKLDKVELDPVKNYFEDKLKDLHSQVKKQPDEEKDSAAGSRSLLIQNANCISCDRPVNIYRDETKFPSLPFAKSFPKNKSTRPFATFELDDMRQQMFLGQNPRNRERGESLGQHKVHKELIKLGAIKDTEDLRDLTNRPCGGNHTLTCPEKRTTIRINKAHREDLHFIAQLSQKDLSIVDILGYDGHVYKGHVTQLPAIPEIPKNAIGRRSATGSGRPRTSSPL